MLHIEKGNLLFSDCTIIAHQTNCFMQMDFGLKKMIKGFFPEVYKADIYFEHEKDERLGKCSFALTKDYSKIIFNLYAQLTEESETDYKAFEKAFETMMITADRFEAKGFPIKIGISYFIGSGIDEGNGEIEVIHTILKQMSKRYNRDIYLYHL